MLCCEGLFLYRKCIVLFRMKCAGTAVYTYLPCLYIHHSLLYITLQSFQSHLRHKHHNYCFQSNPLLQTASLLNSSFLHSSTQRLGLYSLLSYHSPLLILFLHSFFFQFQYSCLTHLSFSLPSTNSSLKHLCILHILSALFSSSPLTICRTHFWTPRLLVL